MSKVLFVSIKHREIKLFEDGIELLRKDGFPVFILNNEYDNYDNGVVKLGELLRTMDWDILHFVDNDCFITDTTYIKQTLKDFEESDLGWVSYFENGYGNDYTKYDFKGTIAEVTDQKFIKEYPYMTPSWENAMMMFKREAWDSITDYSDLQKWFPELIEKRFRVGVKKVEPRLKFTHKGEGFVHIGNLLPYFYKIEKGEEIEVDEITKPRIGYFQKYHGLQGYPDFTKEWEDLIK